MMSRSPRQGVILLLVLSALVLALGMAVAVTFARSATWSAQLARLTGVYAAPSLGITFDGGSKVTALEPGGRAEKEGVKLGDVIYAVNHEPVGEADRLYQIVQGKEMAARVRLGLVREHNKLDVILEPMPLPTETEGAP